MKNFCDVDDICYLRYFSDVYIIFCYRVVFIKMIVLWNESIIMVDLWVVFVIVVVI